MEKSYNVDLENFDIDEDDIEILNKRAVFFRKLGAIQAKYGLPSLSLVQFYARKLKISLDQNINNEMEGLIVQNCKMGNNLIIQTTKEVCRTCSLNEDEQEKFYRLILDNGNICDFFLTYETAGIVRKVSSYNCVGSQKLIALFKEIDPKFDIKEYFKNN